jgi:hypothetical protein
MKGDGSEWAVPFGQRKGAAVFVSCGTLALCGEGPPGAQRPGATGHSARTQARVIHAIIDSTPASRVPVVIQALESCHNDPDVGIRRRVRKTLAHYRRTGKVTDAAH